MTHPTWHADNGNGTFTNPLFVSGRVTNLHSGDNTIAVGVQHGGTWGGLNPTVHLEMIPKATSAQWSRSLFNGLAQVIVQAVRTPGSFTLTASAEGLIPVAVRVEPQAAVLRSAVP